MTSNGMTTVQLDVLVNAFGRQPGKRTIEVDPHSIADVKPIEWRGRTLYKIFFDDARPTEMTATDPHDAGLLLD